MVMEVTAVLEVTIALITEAMDIPMGMVVI
jgi:hypothetical protein